MARLHVPSVRELPIPVLTCHQAKSIQRRGVGGIAIKPGQRKRALQELEFWSNVSTVSFLGDKKSRVNSQTARTLTLPRIGKSRRIDYAKPQGISRQTKGWGYRRSDGWRWAQEVGPAKAKWLMLSRFDSGHYRAVLRRFSQ